MHRVKGSRKGALALHLMPAAVPLCISILGRDESYGVLEPTYFEYMAVCRGDSPLSTRNPCTYLHGPAIVNKTKKSEC